MKNKLTIEQTRKLFKELFIEEFKDSNEAFMDFLLSLISKKTLNKVIASGENTYYSNLKKYL